MATRRESKSQVCAQSENSIEQDVQQVTNSKPLEQNSASKRVTVGGVAGDDTPKFNQEFGIDLMIKGYRSGGKHSEADAARSWYKKLSKEE